MTVSVGITGSEASNHSDRRSARVGLALRAGLDSMSILSRHANLFLKQAGSESQPHLVDYRRQSPTAQKRQDPTSASLRLCAGISKTSN